MNKVVHEVVDPGPVLDGICKWFRGDMGFLQTAEGKDVFVHHTALPLDANGRRIEPKNDGGRVRFRIGRLLKDGVDSGGAATKVEVIDQYVRSKRVA
jgi:cold shock CspA family protein